MDIMTLTLFCLMICTALKLLGSVNPEIKHLCTIFAVCLVAMRYFGDFREIYSSVDELFGRTGLDEGYLAIIVKSLGICFTSQIGCDCCRDCGETALASQLELAGKAAMILISLPLLKNAADIVGQLMQV